METDVSIGNIFNSAWLLLKGSKWPIWAPVLALILAAMAMSAIYFVILFLFGYSVNNAPYFFTAIIQPLLMTLAMAPFYAGIYMVAINQARGNTIDASSGFKYFKHYVPITITLIFITIIANFFTAILRAPNIVTLLGNERIWLELLASIFSLFVYTFLVLSVPLVADKNISPIESLKRSFLLVKPHWWKVLLALVISSLTMIATALPLMFGTLLKNEIVLWLGFFIFVIAIIWVMPFIFLVQGVIYRLLVDKEEPVISAQ